jgi:8-oxo-dGTP diphosphatase
VYKSFLQVWKHLALAKNLQIKLLRIVNDKFLIGVTGVIFNENHDVLLVKHSYRRVAWSLPGGYLQASEHPKKGLEREIYEETNFKVHIEKILMTKHDKDTPRIDMCYVGTYIKGKFKPSEEVVDFEFFKQDKLPKLINDQYKQIELGYKRYNELHKQPLFKRFINLFSS